MTIRLYFDGQLVEPFATRKEADTFMREALAGWAMMTEAERKAALGWKNVSIDKIRDAFEIRPKMNRLAREFTLQLLKTLNDAQMQEVRRRNRTPAYSDACATHDFCDANVLMDTAFENVHGRSFDFNDPADTDLFNAAWDEARAANFRP